MSICSAYNFDLFCFCNAKYQKVVLHRISNIIFQSNSCLVLFNTIFGGFCFVLFCFVLFGGSTGTGSDLLLSEGVWYYYFQEVIDPAVTFLTSVACILTLMLNDPSYNVNTVRGSLKALSHLTSQAFSSVPTANAPYPMLTLCYSDVLSLTIFCLHCLIFLSFSTDALCEYTVNRR